MNELSLSRKARRARASGAERRFDLKGAAARAVQEAYDAMGRGDGAEAARLALPISQSHPKSLHPWLILGAVALDRRDAATARAFYEQARALAPKDPAVLGGLGKALVLAAEVGPALQKFEEALAAGSRDAPMINLYLTLCRKMGWTLRAVDAAGAAVAALEDADLSYQVATLLSEGDEPGRAADWFLRAHRFDPAPVHHRIGRLRALLFKGRFAEALAGCDAFDRVREEEARQSGEDVSRDADSDNIALLRMTALRMLGRLDEALELIEATRFSEIGAFAAACGVAGNILQDQGKMEQAEHALLEGTHAAPGEGRVARSLGVFRFRQGRFAEGEPFYRSRISPAVRARVPYENSAPENLAAQDRLFFLGEQGIGDQLALLTLVRAAPIDLSRTRLTLLGDDRMIEALKSSPLGIDGRSFRDLAGNEDEVPVAKVLHLGDLVRYRQGVDPALLHQPVLRPDPVRVAAIAARYAKKAAGRPVLGMAWRSSGNLTGQLRSIPLAEMVRLAPTDALVIDLQYGSTPEEIAAARTARPDVEIFTDPKIDQMADLAGFFAQLAALETVISIDNTTVHACGAMGHPNCHVMIPCGTESMWYWGDEGASSATGRDAWYGSLLIHRQERLYDWDGLLDQVAKRLAV